MTRWTYRARLLRPPYPGPVLADATSPPYRCVGDYAAIHEVTRQGSAHGPVLVNYASYHRLLAQLVQAAQSQLLLDGPILLEVCRPLGVPLPTALLDVDVLVCDDVEREVAYWSAARVDAFLAVVVRIRRDLHEFGDNTLQLALHSRRHAENPLGALMKQTGLAWAFDEPMLGSVPASQCASSTVPRWRSVAEATRAPFEACA